MATFGLVHGACHGEWCWALLVPELERLGHDAVAMDLPSEDPEAGLRECARAVASALEGTRDVVLVGHSAAGTFLPLAAREAGAAHIVFLCAMVPVAGVSGREQAAADHTMLTFPHDRVQRDEFGRHVTPPDVAREVYYQDCPPVVADWAVAHLRWQSPRPMAERYPDEPWPDAQISSIFCRDDRCVAPSWSRRVSRERLRGPGIELPGGHSPFLSRPRQLAEVLDEIAPGARDRAGGRRMT